MIREVTGTAVRAYTHGPRGFHAQTMPGTAFRYGDPNAVYGSAIYGGMASDAVYPLTDALGSVVALADAGDRLSLRRSERGLRRTLRDRVNR